MEIRRGHHPKFPTSIPSQFTACFNPTSETKQTIACDTNHPVSSFIPNKLHLAFCHLLSTPFALAPEPLLRLLIGPPRKRTSGESRIEAKVRSKCTDGGAAFMMCSGRLRSNGDDDKTFSHRRA